MKEILKTEIITTGRYSISLENILLALLIFIIAYLIVRILSALITRSFKKREKFDGRYMSINQLIKYFIWSIAIIFILEALAINVTFLIASSAALLVGVGIGLQGVFKDFISGVILLIDGTIKIDDVVEVDGMVVKVIEISLRTSKVTTRDDNIVIIPNHKFTEEKIVNWTNNMLPSRFIIEIGIDYSSDIELVEKVLIACALSHPDVLNEKEYMPFVRFKNFGDSALGFELIFYSFNLFRIENVKSKLNFLILDAFRKNGISIPFPQHVVHYANKE